MNSASAIKTTRVSDSAAAGTTDVTSASVDTRGFRAVEFVAVFGDVTETGTATVTIQGSDDDTNFTALDGASATIDDTASDQLVRLDVDHPRHRYLRAVVSRDTANSVVDAIIANQYNAEREPIDDDASVEKSVWVHAPGESS